MKIFRVRHLDVDDRETTRVKRHQRLQITRQVSHSRFRPPLLAITSSLLQLSLSVDDASRMAFVLQNSRVALADDLELRSSRLQ